MREVSTKACARWWMRAGILVVAVVLATLALDAPPVAADQVGICPDGFFVLISAASVPNGAKKDQNGNGLVCAKFSDGRIVGGPDDDTIV
jgi:hypothetical protein